MHKAHRWLLPVLVALGAVGAAPAQAATLVEHNAQPFGVTPNAGSPPEFGRCIKTTGGEFENGACTKTSATSKHYEWYPAFGSAQPLEKRKFTTTIKEATSVTLETVAGTKVVCSGETSTGEYTGDKSIGNVVVTFTGCSGFETACESEGAAPGTVVTHVLEGVLGVETPGAEPSEDKIGEDLYPNGHTGAIAQFTCAEVPLTISGAAIARVVENSMSLADTVKLKANMGHQQPERFFEEPPEVLMFTFNGGEPEQAGETLVTTQTNEEKVEINSVV
jgi:hypothetical protein